MDQSSNHPAGGRTSQRPTVLIVVVFSVSLALFVASVVAGRSLDAGEVLYDLAVGVGIATGLSIIVSWHLEKLAQLEEDRREAVRRDLEEAERRRLEAEARRDRELKEREGAILRRLQELQDAYAELSQQVGFAKLEALVSVQEGLLEDVRDDIREVRRRIDPASRHPYAALTERILDLMRPSIDAKRAGPTRTADVAGSGAGPDDELRKRIDSEIRAFLDADERLVVPLDPGQPPGKEGADRHER